MIECRCLGVSVPNGLAHLQRFVQIVERLLRFAQFSMQVADVGERGRQETRICDSPEERERLVVIVERLLLLSQLSVGTGDMVKSDRLAFAIMNTAGEL